MRLAAYVVTALVVVGALAPLPTGAAAAVPTCRGEAATVVGHGQQTLKGTAGDDVIVTKGAFEVTAGGGDDLICITRGKETETSNVRAGVGDDEVWVVGGRPTDFTWTELGQGADTFHGGAGWEIVWAGKALLHENDGPEDARDAEPDRISTGDGYDSVVVGDLRTALADRVDTGAGPDELHLGATAMTPEATLDLGDGTDRLWFDWSTKPMGAWVFDNTTGTGSLDSEQRLQWSSAEAFELPEPGANALSFVGTDEDEMVWAAGFDDIDLGGGDDSFVQDYSQTAADSTGPGEVHGGPGRDAYNNDGGLGARIDLVAGKVRFDTSDLMVAVDLDGFEDLRVQGGRDPVVIVGDAGDNRIEVSGCRATVDGGGGFDTLLAWGVTRCTASSRAVLRGGSGDDVLVGGTTDDRLVGNDGYDDADGRGGADVCTAEVRRSCAPPT